MILLDQGFSLSITESIILFEHYSSIYTHFPLCLRSKTLQMSLLHASPRELPLICATISSIK